MRTALAVVFGFIIFGVLFATIRGFVGPARGGSSAPQLEVAEPMPAGLRILYWCETCGFEVLVVRRGTENPPRHCGEPMTRREEILRGE